MNVENLFNDAFRGEQSVTFTVPSKFRPIKGNRRQRKAAAFANNKTVWGLVRTYTARSRKADRKRLRCCKKAYEHAFRVYLYLAALRETKI